MDLSFLQEYCTPVIVGICLCVGFIVKKWIADLDNKWIPTINGVLGLLLGIGMYWGSVDLTVILSGLFSGLAATGLHQAFTKMINKEDEGNE